MDIMLVEDPQPDGEAAEESNLAFRKAKAGIYRGQDIECRWKLRTPEEFRDRIRFINSLETSALNDGHVLGEEAEHYSTLSRMRGTNSNIRQANRYAEYLQNCDRSDSDDRQGSQAYLAVSNALEAAVNAAGEWCPEIYDIEMLLELARQADPEGHYVTTVDPEIYTQYGSNRREIPPHTPFTSRPEHRIGAARDVEAILARTEQMKATWPTPRGK